MRTYLFPIVILLVGIAPFLSPEMVGQNPTHPGFSERVEERELMVRDGIENYPYQPVEDPLVLQAMRRVPRHLFVPALKSTRTWPTGTVHF